MADDLGEEWWLNAADDEADEADEREKLLGDSGPLIIDEVKGRSKKWKQSTKKRVKLDDDGECGGDLTPRKRPADAAQSKSQNVLKKRRRMSKARSLANCQNPVEPIDEFHSIATSFQSSMTVVEKDELNMDLVNVIQVLPGTGVITDYFKGELTRCSSLLSRPAKVPGHPFVLVISSSALRVLELKRKIIGFSKECRVAKLFAKHLKMEEQEKMLRAAHIQVAAGTPNRICGLIESGALRLSKLRFVLVDWRWRNSKLQKMVDIHVVRKDLYTLLFKHIFFKSAKHNVQIVLM